MICTLLYALLLLSCTRGQTEEPLIGAALTGHGGRDAITRASVVHASGRIKAVFLGEEGTYDYWFERKGRRLRVETRYARHSETRVLEGTKALRGVARGPLHEVSDFRYEAMLYQYKHIDMLFGLMNGSYRVEDMGEGFTPSGRKSWAFGLRDEEGPPMTILLHPSDGMLMYVSGLFDVNGQRAELGTEYYDYRDVGGLMLPFRLVNYAGGTMIAEIQIDSYVMAKPGAVQ